MKIKDRIISIVFLICSGSLYYYANTFPVRDGRSRALNTGFYPKLLAVILGILALLLLISSLRKNLEGKENKEGKKFWTSKKALLQFFVTIMMLISYPFLLNTLGFAVATLIFILVLIFNLSDRERFKKRNIVFVSIGVTIVIYLVFKVFINIPFPQGYFF